MVSSPGSPAQLRALGIALREMRTEAGLKLNDLAPVAGVSRATLSRLEQGRRIPAGINWTRLLMALGATAAQQDVIMKLVAGAEQPNWLAVGAQLPQQLATLIDFEKAAARIAHVALTLIPGLLQTREYAHAVFKAGGVPQQELDVRLAVRMDRQSVLDRHVDYEVIIDELALGLARPIVDRAATAQQLGRIVTMANRPNVTVRVIPCELGPHEGLSRGSYITLEFPGPTRPIAHMETWEGGIFIDHPKTVYNMIEATARLRQSALSPAESAGLIRRLIGNLEST